MGNKMICAVIGRNIDEIGNGRSETYYKNVYIKHTIAEKITELADGGVTDFICNAEYGFSFWFCEIGIPIRDIRKQHGLSTFRIHIVMPYEEQASQWSDDIHERFYDINEKADEVLILHRRFHKDCYRNSERFMIDNSDFLFTDDENYFAGQYAELHNKQIEVLERTR